MNKKKHDIAIIGGGIAGAFAALKAAESHKGADVVLFELGKTVAKRRRQLESWLGCFPTSDGKLYLNDLSQILDIVDGRKAKYANTWTMKQFESVIKSKIIKDKLPSSAIQKKIKSHNFEIITNDYIQWKPESIHNLSREVFEKIETAGNVTFSFDNEVTKITKQKKGFTITTAEDGDIFARKIILCVGRSGWRWANNLYKEFGLTIADDIASFGVFLECTANNLKEFNKSHCKLIRSDMEIGPFSWAGSLIPEDHADLVISAFRSNEDRWKTDKVMFSLIGNQRVKEGNGVYETDRLAKLAFLLFNDRIGKEKIKTILKKESPLSQLKEYDWLIEAITEVNEMIPNLISKGSYHSPNIAPYASRIRLDTNLETEVEDMYVAGESACIKGILGAAISGAIAMDSACKK
jgi:uncharacterized FAD-dependent dehydrogenase